MHYQNIKSEKYIMKYTLNSGTVKEITLTNKQLEEWIECFKADEKFEVVVDDLFIGINPKQIARFDLSEMKPIKNIQGHMKNK